MLAVPDNMQRVVGGVRYRVATATLLADDQYWDGRNHERNGRNRFLYRTPTGRYFVVTLTMWQGEQDALEPIGEDEAAALYEQELTEHHVDWEDAFPHRKVEEA
jgi:hypothetical protein